MSALIKNETRKLLRRKKTLVTLIAFVVLVGIICFGMYKQKEDMKKYNSPEFRIKNYEENIKSMKEQKNNPNISEDEKKNLDNTITDQENQLQMLKLQEAGIEEKKDWKESLKTQIEELKKNEKNQVDEEGQEEIKNRIATYQYMINNNIKPQDDSTIKAFPFFRELISFLGAIFLAVGVIVFSADMVSGEYTPPTMKVLLTQPASRAKTLLSKYISLILTSIVLILSVEILAFIIMGLIFGFGNPSYPVLSGAKYKYDTLKLANGEYGLKLILGSSYILPIWEFTLRILLMQILFIISCVSFAFLLSTIMKSSMISISLSIVIIIACTIFQNIPYIRKGMPYVFISHGDVSNILIGNSAIQYQNPGFTPLFSVLVLLLWSTICYLISHFVFVKKDILI